MLDQYIWPITVLVVFSGMLALAWRALSIAHDLAKIVLQNGLQLPAPQPVPTTLPKPTAPAATTPAPTEPPAPHPIVTDALVAFTSKQEGFSAKAYWDYKQYTIGYGTKASGPNETITEADAMTALKAELNSAAHAVAAFIPDAPIGVQQAMTDASFNLGTGWMQQSLGAALKAKNYTTAKADLLQYNHAGGQVLEALTKRREAEASWFDNPL